MSKLAALIERIEEMTDDRGYAEFSPTRIIRLTDKAVLVQIEEEEVWFPCSQLRHRRS